MKKVLCILLSAMLLMTAFSFSFAEEAGTSAKMGLGPYIETVETAEKITLPLYVSTPENPGSIELLILNGLQDIPYVCLNDIVSMMNDMIGAELPDYSMTISDEENGLIFVTRDNGAIMTVDTDMHTVTFSDSDLFARMPGAANGMDVNYIMPSDPAYEVTLYRTSSILYRERGTLEYKLDDYDIYMHVQDGKVYLPLQTVSDILLSSALNAFALYNGQCVILTNGISGRQEIDVEVMLSAYISDYMTEDDIAEARTMFEQQVAYCVGPYYDLAKIYYAAEPHAKSLELSVFSYNELCMALDHLYGLKEEHEIDSFDDFFKETGFATTALSEDAYDSYEALRDMIWAYLSDGHSAMGAFTYLFEYTAARHAEYNNISYQRTGSKASDAYTQTRVEYYGFDDQINGYEEVGNTAIITVDSFSLGGFSEYYEKDITDEPEDTIELMIYANRQINRENSPIERVVIDLSLDQGGKSIAAACMVSWVLGYADFKMDNAITGTQAIVRHEFDVNLDHVIDEQDCLLENPNIKGVYVLISPVSFSCANIVPASLKGNPNVTIMGVTSGGGVCSVLNMTTAEGNVFTISSPIRINTVKNGTFYSVDEGVTPDVYISDAHHMYDRQYLVNMINNLD